MPASTLRIAAVADVHYGRHSAGAMRAVFERASEEADVLLLCGDLTDYGKPEEAELLAADLREHVGVPVLAVWGNHDFETDQIEDVQAVLENAGVEVLDGDCTEVRGVGFAGVRGFGGGFGRWALSPWGERPIKAFVQEAVDEELKLDAALSRLGTRHRVVLLHYAPVRATVVGEPEEIFPFLGSSRLEEPLNRYDATVAFHGHAHAGSPEGRTSAGVPVYNVSLPVLRRAYPDRPPFRLFEIDLAEAVGQAEPAAQQ
ncbi:MAG: metallophosphoesterase [Rhodothermales bacterium]|nr:metallophosphoesterase [Rhodothermales bacterium]